MPDLYTLQSSNFDGFLVQYLALYLYFPSVTPLVTVPHLRIGWSILCMVAVRSDLKFIEESIFKPYVYLMRSTYINQ